MAKKLSNETDAPDSPRMIRVQVSGQPVSEDGIHYAKGDTFETTPERAEALGALVSIADAPAE